MILLPRLTTTCCAGMLLLLLGAAFACSDCRRSQTCERAIKQESRARD